MADRVWRPASPKTSKSTPLAPSTTSGCRWKSGAEATYPVTVRTRSTRSSDAELRFQHGQRVEGADRGGGRPLLDASPSCRACRRRSVDRRSAGSWPEVRATPPCTTTASSGSCGGWGPCSVSPSSARRARTRPPSARSACGHPSSLVQAGPSTSAGEWTTTLTVRDMREDLRSGARRTHRAIRRWYRRAGRVAPSAGAPPAAFAYSGPMGLLDGRVAVVTGAGRGHRQGDRALPRGRGCQRGRERHRRLPGG